MLMVVGLNHRTAPVAVRERFWVGEDRRAQILPQLARAEGIEEVMVLSTCDRTEFLLWANDAAVAANSVFRFLSSEYSLKLCEWEHFYRLLDDDAFIHILRVVSGLDSMAIGESQIVLQCQIAWQQAKKVGSTAGFLNAVMQRCLTASQRVRAETAVGSGSLTLPHAAVELAQEVLGSCENKKALLFGAGEMSERSAQALINCGVGTIWVANRTWEHAQELAAKLGGVAVPLDGCRKCLVEADIVVCATSCPHTILSREEAEAVAAERKRRPLVIVDTALPRDVDPGVRHVRGISLYDLDDLEKVIQQKAGERRGVAQAEEVITAEARSFRRKLLAQHVVPTIIALRNRLDEICRQELDSFREECGPFSKDEHEMLLAVTSRITYKIAGCLVRELKELPERQEQELMTVAVQRLFHLPTPEAALAGASSEPQERLGAHS